MNPSKTEDNIEIGLGEHTAAQQPVQRTIRLRGEEMLELPHGGPSYKDQMRTFVFRERSKITHQNDEKGNRNFQTHRHMNGPGRADSDDNSLSSTQSSRPEQPSGGMPMLTATPVSESEGFAFAEPMKRNCLSGKKSLMLCFLLLVVSALSIGMAWLATKTRSKEALPVNPNISDESDESLSQPPEATETPTSVDMTTASPFHAEEATLPPTETNIFHPPIAPIPFPTSAPVGQDMGALFSTDQPTQERVELQISAPAADQQSSSPPSQSPAETPPPPRTTSNPTRAPSEHPTTSSPTWTPTHQPSTSSPTRAPTDQPTTSSPTRHPTEVPTKTPTLRPTRQPTRQPTRHPTRQPTRQPTPRPTLRPTLRPTRQPVPPNEGGGNTNDGGGGTNNNNNDVGGGGGSGGSSNNDGGGGGGTNNDNNDGGGVGRSSNNGGGGGGGTNNDNNNVGGGGGGSSSNNEGGGGGGGGGTNNNDGGGGGGSSTNDGGGGGGGGGTNNSGGGGRGARRR